MFSGGHPLSFFAMELFFFTFENTPREIFRTTRSYYIVYNETYRKEFMPTTMLFKQAFVWGMGATIGAGVMHAAGRLAAKPINSLNRKLRKSIDTNK